MKKKNHGWYYLHLTSLNRFLYIICEKIEKFDCTLSMTFISERMLHFVYVLASANINFMHLPHKKKEICAYGKFETSLFLGIDDCWLVSISLLSISTYALTTM
jgi:hypothetical protein